MNPNGQQVSSEPPQPASPTSEPIDQPPPAHVRLPAAPRAAASHSDAGEQPLARSQGHVLAASSERESGSIGGGAQAKTALKKPRFFELPASHATENQAARTCEVSPNTTLPKCDAVSQQPPRRPSGLLELNPNSKQITKGAPPTHQELQGSQVASCAPSPSVLGSAPRPLSEAGLRFGWRPREVYAVGGARGAAPEQGTAPLFCSAKNGAEL